MYKRPTGLMCVAAATFATVMSTIGCSGAEEKGTVIVIDDRGRGEPNLTFGGVKLTSSAKDVIRLCAERGWQHNIKEETGDQRARVVPSNHKEVRTFALIFEDGALIQLTAEFHKPDPRRHSASRHYASRRRMPDGAWAMSDGRRQTVVIINRDGNRLHAVHIGRMRDRAEAERMLTHFVSSAADAPHGAQQPDPGTADAPKAQ